MAPGEYRRVPASRYPEGVSNMQRMNNTNWFTTGSGTYGIGWTDRHIFDEETGRLYNIQLREQFPTSVTWMEADLSMDGVPVGPEAGFTRRRPFNRFCDGGDGYLYFAPSVPADQIGRLVRAHVTTPHLWEDVGAPRINTTSLSGSQSDGSFSLVRDLESGNFLMYTTGIGRGDKAPEGIWEYEIGRVWVWNFGRDAWEMVGRTQSCGYVGTLVYNPIRREVLIWGGSNAYSNPHPLGGRCMATYSTDGVFTRHGPSGLFYSAASRRATYHPVTGDYIMMDQLSLEQDGKTVQTYKNRTWIGDPVRGKPFRLMQIHERGEVFSSYENYHRVCPLPRTDVLIWSDCIKGIILHKPRRWEDLEGAEEALPTLTDEDGGFIDDTPVTPEPEPEDPDTTPPVEPDEPDEPVIVLPDPPPPFEGEFPSIAGTTLEALINQCQPGRTLKITDAALPAESWSQFLSQNQLNPGVGVPRDNPTWGSQAHWDRLRLRSFHLGDRTALNNPDKMHFSSYLAGSHAFIHAPLDPRIGGKAHPYGQQALDDVGGYYYYGPEHDRIKRLRIDSGQWEFIEVNPNDTRHVGQSPVCWHEALGMLVTLDGNKKGTRLRGWRDGLGGWVDLGETGHDGYHAHGRYSRMRSIMMVVGGNHNANRVTIIDALGLAHRMADKPSEIDGIPFSAGMSNTNLSDCPVTGNFLLWDQKQRVMWEYNPEKDEWSVGGDWRVGQPLAGDWSGPYYGNPVTPIYGTDAMLWLSGHTPRIYRRPPVI
jgi:hypothetical protein